MFTKSGLILHYYSDGQLITLFDRSKRQSATGTLILESRKKQHVELVPAPLVAEKPVKVKKTELTAGGVMQQRQFEKEHGIVQPVKVKKTWKLPQLNIPAAKVSPGLMRFVAGVFLLVALAGFVYAGLPVLAAGINQQNSKLPASTATLPLDAPVESTPAPTIKPIDWQDFFITIPRISVDSKVVANVDMNSVDDYQSQLLENGVAHALGSYAPGEKGPVVLFAHSTDTVANIVRFNAKFFAAKDLQPGDEIVIQFNHKLYHYAVTSKEVISPKDLDAIRNTDADLVLSTCYPPGTSWQRLIIFAKLVNS